MSELLTGKGEAAARYEALVVERQPYLDMARECSKYTIPSLIPPEGHTASSKLPTPWQSLGSDGVTNIASKLMLVLLPPNNKFFRFMMTEEVQKLVQNEGEKTLFDAALAEAETATINEIETTGVRAPLFEGLQHLAVAGNVLLQQLTRSKASKGGIRVFPLSQYVVQRDPAGNVLEIVIEEEIAPVALPEHVYEAVKESIKKDEKTVKLYTHIKREQKEYTIQQEVKGVVIPESIGTYNLDDLPYLALRWKRIDGEHYGRGLCEQKIGDLKSCETLSQAMVEGTAIGAKVVILVNPNGLTRMDTLVEAPNGAVREGLAEDVSIVRVEKMADFSIAKSMLDKIEDRLQRAFLMHSSIQRQGERVTAEEIRYMAQELENALGGVYSVFSEELQLPLVKLTFNSLVKQGRMPRLDERLVRPAIVTGIDGLGRSQELQRLDLALAGAVQVLGPAAMQQVNPREYMIRRFTALGIDQNGLLKSEQQLALEQQQAQEAMLVDKVGSAAIKAGADMINQ